MDHVSKLENFKNLHLIYNFQIVNITDYLQCNNILFDEFRLRQIIGKPLNKEIEHRLLKAIGNGIINGGFIVEYQNKKDEFVLTVAFIGTTYNLDIPDVLQYKNCNLLHNLLTHTFEYGK